MQPRGVYDIEALYKREKVYFDFENFKNIEKESLKEEIISKLNSSKRDKTSISNINFLKRINFASKIVNSESIYRQIISKKISFKRIQNSNRYFIKKGASFTSSSGKKFRAGQFLKGNSLEQSIKDLLIKSKE